MKNLIIIGLLTLISACTHQVQAKSGGLPITLQYETIKNISPGQTKTIAFKVLARHALEGLTLSIKGASGVSLSGQQEYLIPTVKAGETLNFSIEASATELPAYITISAKAENIPNRGFFTRLQLGQTPQLPTGIQQEQSGGVKVMPGR